MKQKTYVVNPPKPKYRTVKVNVDITNLPSEVHKDCIQKCRPAVFEDRRFKKPKYKNKEAEYGNY